MSEKASKNKSLPKEPTHEYVPFTKLYAFATWLDYLMMFVAVVMAAGAGAALPCMSLIFGSMVTVMTEFQMGLSSSEKFMEGISQYSLYFVYIGIAVFAATYLFTACSIFVSERLSHRMRESYLKAVLHMDIAWFDKLGPGEITTRITNDTNLYQDGIGEKVAAIFQDCATFIAGLVIALSTEWRLALAVCCIIPVIIVCSLIINVLAGRYTTSALDEYSKAGTLAEESIVSIRTAVAFNQQKKLISMYNLFMKRAEVQGIKKVYVLGACAGAIFVAIYCGYAIAFYYGGQLINWGIANSGTVIKVFFAILIGAFSLSNVPPNLQAVTYARGAAANLLEAIEHKPKINSASNEGLRLSRVEGHLKFTDIAFHYPSRTDVSIFENFSLSIKAGTTVALVGASGSGKSTTIQLLERFYDPISGVVSLDDNDITKLNLKWYRQQLGLVSQEPTLFSGTIADNVALGLIGTEQEHHPREQQMNTITEACKQANAHSFITTLPLGYDTQVGERGFLLSGGQKQRIAIARAIVKDPRILLLDEATSALDTKSEGVVQEALDRASEGRTTIVIAHRLSTVKKADVIVVMEKGKVIETGSHIELMAKPDGAYHNLVTLQEVRKEKEEATPAPTERDSTEFPVETVEAARIRTMSSTHSTRSNIEEGISSTFTTPLRKLVSNVVKLNNTEVHWILLGTLGATILGLIYPIFAIIFSNILEAFSKTGDALLDATSFWALMFFILAICAGLGQFASQVGFGMASEILSTKLRSNSFRSILDQEVGWFDRDRNSAGALVTALSQDAQDIQGLSGTTFGSILNIAINLVSCIIVGLVYGWKLALVVIAVLPLILYSGYLRVSLIKKIQIKNKQSYSQSAEMACENAAAMRTVASLTKENRVLSEYSHSLEGPLKAGYKNALISSVMYAFSLCTNFFMNALVFWYGGTLLSTHEYDIQNFFTVFMALLVGASGAARVFAFAPDMNRARDAAASFYYITHREPHIDSSESCPGRQLISRDEKATIKGAIKLENVHFHYPTRPGAKVLRGVDFEAQPGQFVALVGPSGCGKSTSIGLLERFYDVSKGRVLIDGVDVRDFHLPSYRDHLALVGQEPALYDLSIRDNILFGARTYGPPPTQEDIEQAAKDANIHEFIMSLPNGYETMVGGKGSQLSGGQKQRIAIARALIRHPSILLLDEATSALDADSERIVQAALNQASKGRTTLAIAHRLSSIQHADVILVFSNGSIVERGTHDQLLSLHGQYYEMVQQQVLDTTS